MAGLGVAGQAAPMSPGRHLLVWGFTLLLAACADEASAPDGGVGDVGPSDHGEAPKDAGRDDRGEPDLGDGGSEDAGSPDLGPLDLGEDAGAPDAGRPTVGQWQIPEAFRVGQKLPLYGLHPRPDSETSSTAFHRVAHPDMPYRLPVAVQGGEWPFRYALLEGPDGMVFEASELERELTEEGWIAHRRTEGYGVLSWPQPTAGLHRVRVEVSDQSGASIELGWTVELAPGAFVFVDSVNGDDASDGSFAAPLRSFGPGLWRGDDADQSFAGRVAVFRAGRYEVQASMPNTSPILSRSAKPGALVGFPDEAVELDLSAGHFRTRGLGFNDYFIAHIDFTGSRSDLANNRLFNITNRAARITFWELSFDDTTLGTAKNDNPACIAFMGTGPYHENLAVLDSRLGPGAAAQLVVTFDSNHVLLEGNHVDGVSFEASNGANGLHAKDDTNNLSIRNNRIVGRFPSSGIAVSNQITLGSAENQEICWNVVDFTGDMNVDAAVSLNKQSNTPDAENVFVYRNTVISPQRAFLFRGNGDMPIPPLVEGNAYRGEQGGLSGGNKQLGPVENQSLEPGDLDAQLRLIGAAREAYVGRAGAELLDRSEP